MDISVYFRTYNSYGGDITLSLIGDYLMLDAPAFGDAVADIEVIMHFRCTDPPRKTLESRYYEFHAGLNQLPTLTFRRKKRKVETAFYCERVTARAISKSRQLSHELFCHGCREVVENLMLLRKRIRSDDSFDFVRFQTWLEHRVEQLPPTLEDLSTIYSDIEIRRIAAREKLSDWDKTGIDFDDFHPDARSVLDDPRLWDVCDEWSPNGNDTGADVLGLYRDWRKRNRNMNAEKFFQQLLQSWEVEVPPNPADQYSVHTYHQAIVGLAFAQLKLHAKCDPTIALLAINSLAEQPDTDPTDQLAGILRRYS